MGEEWGEEEDSPTSSSSMKFIYKDECIPYGKRLFYCNPLQSRVIVLRGLQ